MSRCDGTGAPSPRGSGDPQARDYWSWGLTMPDPFREISEAEVHALLPHWDVGAFVGLPGERGGTANPAVVVDTSQGRFFVKRRNPRYAALEMLHHDHALMEHLAGKRYPTPLAVVSREGRRWVEADGDVFELYPYMPGDPHDPSDLAEVEAAGRALAAFHKAASDFTPPPGKAWPRYHDPAKTVEALEWALTELVEGAADRQTVEGLRKVALDLARDLPDGAYWSCPQMLVHGDWHPANVKYSRGEVCGVFDLDWATRQPRLVDIADGVMFFAGVRPTPVDGGDIRSLTQPFGLEPARTNRFMAGYLSVGEVTSEELRLLPSFMLARWLYCRADPMRRKIPRGDALAYLLDGIRGPIEEIRHMTTVTGPFTEC